MNWDEIKTVVFDVDDTLYLESDYIKSGFQAVGEYLRQSTEVCGAAQKAWQLYCNGVRGNTFDLLLTEYGITDVSVSELIGIYRSHQPDICIAEDAQRFIDRVRYKVKLAIISDGPLLAQEKKIKALRLKDFCSQIILTDQWGPEFWKPHPRAFREVENALDCAGRQCVYIADNPAKDFIAPIELGWQTVWMKRPERQHVATISKSVLVDDIVENFDELVL